MQAIVGTYLCIERCFEILDGDFVVRHDYREGVRVYIYLSPAKIEVARPQHYLIHRMLNS